MLVFILLSTFPGWHVEVDDQTGSVVDVKPFPSRSVTTVCLALSFFAAVMSIGAAFWHHVSCATAATFMKLWGLDLLSVSVGPIAVAFAWLGASLLCGVFWACFVTSTSMEILDNLTDGNFDHEDDNTYWKRMKGIISNRRLTRPSDSNPRRPSLERGPAAGQSNRDHDLHSPIQASEQIETDSTHPDVV